MEDMLSWMQEGGQVNQFHPFADMVNCLSYFQVETSLGWCI